MRFYLKLSALLITAVVFFAASRQAAAYQQLYRIFSSPNTGDLRAAQQELAAVKAQCWNPWS